MNGKARKVLLIPSGVKDAFGAAISGADCILSRARNSSVQPTSSSKVKEAPPDDINIAIGDQILVACKDNKTAVVDVLIEYREEEEPLYVVAYVGQRKYDKFPRSKVLQNLTEKVSEGTDMAAAAEAKEHDKEGEGGKEAGKEDMDQEGNKEAEVAVDASPDAQYPDVPAGNDEEQLEQKQNPTEEIHHGVDMAAAAEAKEHDIEGEEGKEAGKEDVDKEGNKETEVADDASLDAKDPTYMAYIECLKEEQVEANTTDVLVSDPSCNYCDLVFSSSGSLARHIKNVHYSKKPYQCETCRRRFADKDELVMHSKRHMKWTGTKVGAGVNGQENQRRSVPEATGGPSLSSKRKASPPTLTSERTGKGKRKRKTSDALEEATVETANQAANTNSVNSTLTSERSGKVLRKRKTSDALEEATVETGNQAANTNSVNSTLTSERTGKGKRKRKRKTPDALEEATAETGNQAANTNSVNSKCVSELRELHGKMAAMLLKLPQNFKSEVAGLAQEMLRVCESGREELDGEYRRLSGFIEDDNLMWELFLSHMAPTRCFGSLEGLKPIDCFVRVKNTRDPGTRHGIKDGYACEKGGIPGSHKWIYVLHDRENIPVDCLRSYESTKKWLLNPMNADLIKRKRYVELHFSTRKFSSVTRKIVLCSFCPDSLEPIKQYAIVQYVSVTD